MKARLYKYMYITIATMCHGCLVVLKICTTATVIVHLISSNIIRVNVKPNSGLFYLRVCYVLNDIFKQLQENMSFLYFSSFYKLLVYFRTFLMLLSTPNILQTFSVFSDISHVIVHPKDIVQNKYQKQNKVAFTYFFL